VIGLVWKDVLVMRKALRTYGMLLLFYLLMVVMGMLSLSIVVVMVEVIIMILPISAFSYDEMAKWDRYAAAMPLSKREMVGARYLFVLLMMAIAAAFGFAACAVMTIVGDGSVTEGLMTVLVALAAGLVIADFMLPLCYKLGPERARPYMYLVIFIPTLALFAGTKMGLLDRVDWSWLDRLSQGAVLGLFALLPAAALGGLGLSWLISCRIMEKKEF